MVSSTSLPGTRGFLCGVVPAWNSISWWSSFLLCGRDERDEIAGAACYGLLTFLDLVMFSCVIGFSVYEKNC